MSLSGSKTHRLWYADAGRKAKKEIVVYTQSSVYRHKRWAGLLHAQLAWLIVQSKGGMNPCGQDRGSQS